MRKVNISYNQVFPADWTHREIEQYVREANTVLASDFDRPPSKLTSLSVNDIEKARNGRRIP